jgi:hypothetical protein
VEPQAPSAAFSAYLASSPAARRPRPDLAEQIDDNLCLLRVLRDEMRGQVDAVEREQMVLQRCMSAAVDGRRDTDAPGNLRGGPAVGVILISAALADGMHADVDLIVSRGHLKPHLQVCVVACLARECDVQSGVLVQGRVAGGVALGTPAEQIASYVTLLRIQPHLLETVLTEVLSWRRGKEGRSSLIPRPEI